MTRTFRIRSLAPPEAREAATALAAVMADCVAGGASVGFMADMTLADAEAFWRGQTGADDGRAILVAEDEAGIFGVVQVIPAWQPNQPHRVDIAKLLVHRRGRSRGAAEALMRAAEDSAREMGRTLMTLDAVTDGPAARLYDKIGWSQTGVIPDYALMPDGALTPTTIFFKALRP
jgi:GNAT superfamily N-acetyltransferase